MRDLDTAADALLKRPLYDDTLQPDTLFDEALKKNIDGLRALFPNYDRFLDGGLETRPVFLPVLKNTSWQLPAIQTVATITTSGTSGKPVSIPLDDFSLRHRVLLMKAVYEAMGFRDIYEDAFCFLLDPQTSAMSGSVITTKTLQSYGTLQRITFIARAGAKGLELNMAELNRLFTTTFAKPVLIIGYPAMIAHAIEVATKQGVAARPLPENSAILTGGGWKSFLPGVTVDSAQFRPLVSRYFSLPEERIRDMFGLTESPVVFVQCEAHHFHVPTLCRVAVVDPLTQNEVAEGETGLLKVSSPFTTSFPLASILTTDKASLHHSCECGRKAPYFVPRGRSRAATFETCAMKVGQLIK